MLQITQLGLIIIPLCLWFYNNGQKLLSIAVLSTAFGAASVLNLRFGGFGLGIIPPYFPGLIFIIYSILRYLAGQSWGNERAVAHLYLPFILFVLYSACVTLVVPQVMAGRLLVWPQRPDLFNIRIPLYLGTGNLSQLSYVIFTAVFCFLATCYVEKRPWIAERLLLVCLVNGYAVVLFGLWQFASRIGGVYFPNDFFYSNSFATVYTEQVIGSTFRLSGSFNEPASLAGHVCGTIYATFWLILRGDKRRLVLALFVLSTTLVLLSTSTTGYIVLVIGLPSMMAMSAISGKAAFLLRLLKIILCTTLVVMALIVTVPWVSPELAARTNEVIQATLEKKDSQSFDERTTWDADAISLVAPTLGFGAGWGSLRSSSLGPAILGGTGIWGFGLFTWFILRVGFAIRRARQRLANHPAQVLVLEALSGFPVAMLLGALLAGPNLNAMEAWLPLAAALGLVARTRRTYRFRVDRHQSQPASVKSSRRAAAGRERPGGRMTISHIMDWFSPCAGTRSLNPGPRERR